MAELLCIDSVYITELDDFNTGIIDKDVIRKGAEETFNSQCNFLDCSRISASGMRLIQTIDATYSLEISKTLYLIYNYLADEKDTYFKKLLSVHNANLAYEKDNPPIVYKDKKRKTSNSKNTKSKENKEQKVSSKAKRLAIKAMKLNALTFKLKQA